MGVMYARAYPSPAGDGCENYVIVPTLVCVAGARDAAGLGAMRDPLCAIGPRAMGSCTFVVCSRWWDSRRAAARSTASSSCCVLLPPPSRALPEHGGLASCAGGHARWGAEGTGGESKDSKRSERPDGGRRNGSCTRCRRVVCGACRSRVRRTEEKLEEGHADGRPECGSTHARGFSGQFVASLWPVPTHLTLTSPALLPSSLQAPVHHLHIF
ncbi:hypothetical protein B0H13DRAFT_2658977 [Mycena leptocephala]|nr:hypothetical protein B0H13DRAFT_2658977 [Mycena leptocephala]